MLSKYADYRPKLTRPVRHDNPMFQTVLDAWWEAHSKTLAPGSLKSYTPCVARAMDAFAGYRMSEVSADKIAALLADMKSADFSAKVIANQHSVISMICDYYVEHYGAEYNASRMIRNPKGTRKTKRSRPAVPQRKLLETQISSSGGGLFLGFLLYTSARRGEILALQWKDIDLETKMIRITKSVTYMGNAPIVTKTKTENSVRENPILDPFLPVIQAALSGKHPATNYIFGGKQPITSSQFGRMWVDLMEPIGLVEITDGSEWKGNRKNQRHALITPHQLRHEYAYTLYKAGIPALLAKTLMGHSDIQTTQNIYTELGTEDIDDSAKLLNAYFNARKSE